MTEQPDSLVRHRLFVSVVSLALLLACVTVSFVTGPTEVGLDSVAEWVVDIDVEPYGGGVYRWSFYIVADVPEEWEFHSCLYQGEIDGHHFFGEGTRWEPSYVSPCVTDWPPVQNGYERVWIVAETYETHLTEGWGMAFVRFGVHGSTGEHELTFQVQGTNLTLDAADCSNSSYLTVTVVEGLIFSDSFESGSTSAWSAVGP